VAASVLIDDDDKLKEYSLNAHSRLNGLKLSIPAREMVYRLINTIRFA